MILLLPNTNIYKPNNEPNYIQPISQSTQYYLNKIKTKTQNFDYSYFINIYNTNSKIRASTQSFYVFIEILQHFELTVADSFIYYSPKNETIDFGIIEAFQVLKGINNSIQFGINARSDQIPEEFVPIFLPLPSSPPSPSSQSNMVIILDEFSIDEIKSQPIGSTLILKIENCIDEYTIKTLYFLCSIYGKVFITKPISSWGGSSTKYVICKYYKGCATTITTIANIKPTNLFLTKMTEINCIYVELQIETLLSIFNKPINISMKTYHQRCINWFIKFCENIAIISPTLLSPQFPPLPPQQQPFV
jgi:hypothetical protein